jgi:hypothetical protein
MNQVASSRLEQIAAKIAKNPKVQARVERSYANLASGNALNALEALKDVSQQRSKAESKTQEKSKYAKHAS